MERQDIRRMDLVMIQFTHSSLDGAICLLIGKLLGTTQYKFVSYNQLSTFDWNTMSRQLLDAYDKTILMTNITFEKSYLEKIVRENPGSKFIYVDNVSVLRDDIVSSSNLKYAIDESKSVSEILYNTVIRNKLSCSNLLQNLNDLVLGISSLESCAFDKSVLGLDLARVFQQMVFGSFNNQPFVSNILTFISNIHRDPPQYNWYPIWFKANLKKYFNSLNTRISSITRNSKLVSGIRVYFVDSKYNIPVFELALRAKGITGESNIAVVYVSGNKISVSLRTNNEKLDLTKICKNFNGGGKKHAAGFLVKTKADIESSIQLFASQL